MNQALQRAGDAVGEKCRRRKTAQWMASAQIEESASKRKVRRSTQGRPFDAVARPPATVQWKLQRLGSVICLVLSGFLLRVFNRIRKFIFSIAAN